MAECDDFQVILLPVACCSLHDEAVLSILAVTTAAPLADWHGSRGSRPALAETADLVCRWSNTCKWHCFRRTVLDIEVEWFDHNIQDSG